MKYFTRILVDGALVLLLVALIVAPISLSALVRVTPPVSLLAQELPSVLGAQVEGEGTVTISGAESGSLYQLRLRPLKASTSGSWSYGGVLVVTNNSSEEKVFDLHPFAPLDKVDVRAVFSRSHRSRAVIQPGGAEEVTIFVSADFSSAPTENLSSGVSVQLFVGER